MAIGSGGFFGLGLVNPDKNTYIYLNRKMTYLRSCV
ncbi:MAG: hypothetical protein ACLSCV_02230 [Acutalibacteraceae bacterium]